MNLHHLRVLCIAGLVALLIGFSPRFSSAAQPTQSPEDRNRELGIIVLGNHVFTFLHELGHALINQLDLPIVGQEEDAADEFAIIALLAFARDEQAAPDEREGFYRFGLAGAQAFMKLWELTDRDIGGQTAKLPFWDEHGLELKRVTNIMCLLYGGDPERFKEIVTELNMPEDRRARCVDDYPARDRAWTRLLTPHLQPAAGERKPSGKMTVRYGAAGSSASQEMARSLQQIQVLEAFVSAVNVLFVLPHDITVWSRDCGEANAYWNPDDRTINMCYELMALVGSLISGQPAAAEQPPPKEPPGEVPQPPPASDQALYFAAEAGKPVGPMTLAQLKARVAAKQTSKSDLVWKAGMPDWVPANQLPDLKDAFTQ